MIGFYGWNRLVIFFYFFFLNKVPTRYLLTIICILSGCSSCNGWISVRRWPGGESHKILSYQRGDGTSEGDALTYYDSLLCFVGNCWLLFTLKSLCSVYLGRVLPGTVSFLYASIFWHWVPFYLLFRATLVTKRTWESVNRSAKFSFWSHVISYWLLNHNLEHAILFYLINAILCCFMHYCVPEAC